MSAPSPGLYAEAQRKLDEHDGPEPLYLHAQRAADAAGVTADELGGGR